jgi:hypothetical protein
MIRRQASLTLFGSRGRLLSHGLRTGLTSPLRTPLRMDSPPIGWVTALAGLLARGSVPRRPAFPVSQWLRTTSGLAADSCGGSHGSLHARHSSSPCSLFRLQLSPKNQRMRNLPCPVSGVKSRRHGSAGTKKARHAAGLKAPLVIGGSNFDDGHIPGAAFQSLAPRE